MKKLLLLFFVVCSFTGYGQKLIVTPDGLKNSEDIEKTYVIIEAPDMTAKQLYDNAIKYINQNYKNPDEVIKGKTEGEYLKFATYVEELLRYNNSGAKIPIEAKYTTELYFKEGKVKYEIISLEMYHFNVSSNITTNVLFTGGLFSGYIIYKKNGKLFKADTKQDIETYFNTQIVDLTKHLKGETQDDNW